MQANTTNKIRVENATRDFSTELSNEIVRRFELYQYGLRSARGAILTADSFGISRALFQKYSATRDVNTEFPGALGFGFIRRVPQEDITTFLIDAKNDGWADFAIKELAPNSGERYVIQYIEPVARNTAAVGLDIASENNRRAAAHKAILSGEVRLTGPITLVQATGKRLQSFLILMPIYATGLTPETTELREQYGFGWSYAPLIIGEVLANLNIDPKYYHIELTDVTDPQNPEVFFLNDTAISDFVFTASKNVSIYGRKWQIKVSVLPALVSQFNQVKSVTIGLLGVLITFLGAGLVSAFAASRASRAATIAEQFKLASFVSSSNDGIIGLTPKGDITTWNLGAEQILGFTFSDVFEKSLKKVIIPNAIKERFQELLCKANKGDSIMALDLALLHKNGKEIPTSISISPILTKQKAVSAISVIVRDISIQKKAEQQIKDLNTNLEAQVEERTSEALHVRDQLLMASDAADLGVWIWDCITNELNWNDKMFDMYQYPLSLRNEGIDYANWFDRIHPEDQAATSESLQKALANEETWNSNFRLVWPNGQIRHINARALAKFDDEGTPLSVTGVNRDFTSDAEHEERLRLAKRQADAANAAKSLFLSNMSHEIRTPMNGVYGILQLLKKEKLSEKGRSFIDKAEYSCKNLLAIINDVLDISKIEAGKITFESVDFSLSDLLEKFHLTCYH